MTIMKIGEYNADQDFPKTLCAWSEKCPKTSSCEECGFLKNDLYFNDEAIKKFTELGYCVVEIENECLPNI
jgi:hypothetical protein